MLFFLGTRNRRQRGEVSAAAARTEEEERAAEARSGPASRGRPRGGTRGGTRGGARRTETRGREDELTEDEEPYDPENPTEDAPGGGNGYNQITSELKQFLSSQINSLRVSLESQVRSSQDQFAQNLSQHLAHLDNKISEKAQRPVLKNNFNQKHFDRVQVYKNFLKDAKYSLESGNVEEGVTCIEACVEAINKYQRDIQLADKSAVGWELVERLGQGPEDRDVRALERKILEERRINKKRKQDEHQGEDIQSPKSQAPGSKLFGPCVWCSGAGHGYKYCRIWKSDVSAGRAIFDSNARKWIRVNGDEPTEV